MISTISDSLSNIGVADKRTSLTFRACVMISLRILGICFITFASLASLDTSPGFLML